MENKDFVLLIVDDEEAIRNFLAQDFKMEGYTVFTAGGGEEALKISQDKKIDMIITDIRMPEGDGVYLLEEIRKRDSRVPVILMITGHAKISNEEAIEKGAMGILDKPLDMGELEDYVKKVKEQIEKGR